MLKPTTFSLRRATGADAPAVAAVLAAYGWPADLGREDLLARLLALNLARDERPATTG